MAGRWQGTGSGRAAGAATGTRQPARHGEAAASELDLLHDAPQRRQLTVMFCDMAGSTRLSTRLDPEDLREVLSAFLKCCTDEIEAAGGYVARFMGDGVLAYFGYPRVREDDAERAVRAALAIRTAAPRLRVAHGGPPAVRVGVATGVVVVGEVLGDGPARERAVVGETPNLAARLQSSAGRNEVIVSELTRRLSETAFAYEDLGPRRLKGLPAATPLHRLIGPRAAPGAGGRRGPGAALAGRVDELAWLSRHWQAAAGGQGRVVQVTGPAGIGKSRLVEELRLSAAAGPALWLAGEASELLRATALQPIAMLVRRALRLGDGPAGPDPARRLRRALTRAGIGDEDAAGLIADLAGLGEARPRLSAQAQRALLLASLRDWLLAVSRRRPTVVVLEDLHWGDPSTLELLQDLTPRIGSARLLVICTSRRATVRGLGAGRAGTLRIGPLKDAEVEDLVRSVAGPCAAEGEIRAAVARADGVPLFAEELAKLIAGGDGRGRPEIPATLSDLLMARLDALGPIKAVAQIAAVLGHDGDTAVLAACAGQTPAQAARTVDQLAAAGVLAWRKAEAGAYGFRHALVREAAYQALLKSQRRILHRRAAVVLARDFPELAAARPEVLAQHWTQAGNAVQALAAWTEAGRLAASRRAHGEAERSYAAAITVLADLPASAERAEGELELWSGLATARQITRGYSAAETVAATTMARRLAERDGDIKQQFSNGAGAWMAASSAGDYPTARRLADRLLRLAKAEGGEGFLGSAYMMLLTARYRTGDLIGAEEAFEHGATAFRSEAFRRLSGGAAQAFGNAAVNAWILDQPDEARARLAAALEISLANGNPYEAAFVQYMVGMVAVLMGDPAGGAALAEKALKLSQDGGFPQFEATSRIVLGRALAGLGDAAQGVRLITAGLEEMERKTRSKAGLTMCLTWRAEVLALSGDPVAALAAHDVALTANRQERFFRPEGLRLRGETKASLGWREEALEDLEAAHALAREIGAVLFERRAADSLAAAGAGTSARERPAPSRPRPAARPAAE